MVCLTWKKNDTKVIKDALKVLGKENFALIVHGSSFPARDGEDTGYQDGYNAGETIGYQNGYNAGVEHGGNYSFMGLIGAVIDAPVSAFTSLLNFELLGVNILGFISGLLTLALIIFIIKLCMGGK